MKLVVNNTTSNETKYISYLGKLYKLCLPVVDTWPEMFYKCDF